MAVTTDNLLVNVAVDTANAAKSLDQLTKQFGELQQTLNKTNKATEKTADSVSGMGAGMVKVAAGISVAKSAFDAVIGPIKGMVREFQSAQDEQRNLVNILKLTGDNVRDTYGDFQDFADSMADTTVVSGGLATQLLTSAKSMGLSNEMAKKLVKTSADLAAVTGKDVRQSYEGLVGTLRGNAKAVGEVGALLNDLTKEELEAGKGVERLAETFKGQGEGALKTFGGQLQYVSNQFDSLMETFGGIISDIFNLDDAAVDMGKALKRLGEFVKENKDDFVSLGKTVVSLADDAMNELIGVLAAVGSHFVQMAGNAATAVSVIAKGLNFIGVVSDETAAAISDFRDGVNDMASDLRGTATQAFKAFGDEGDSAMEQVKQRTSAVDEETKKYGKTLRGATKDMMGLKEEGKKALEELQKKMSDMSAKNADIGAGETQQVLNRLDASNREVKLLEDKLRKAGMLVGENEKLVEQARELAREGAAKELDTLRLKNAGDLLNKNAELSRMLQADGKSRLQLIDEETQAQINLLQEKTKGLSLDTAGTDALKEQIELLKQKGEAEKSKGPGQKYEAISKVGDDIGKSISGVMKTGAMEMMGGLASAAGGIMGGVTAVVGVVDALLDFIPQILNQIAGIFDKVADLPNMLLDAVKNIGRAVTNFTANFIPDLFKAIPEILESLIDAFIFAIPDAFMGLIEKLPEIIQKFVDKLGEMTPKLIAGLVASAPKLVVAIIQGLIKGIPEIIKSTLKASIVELPKQIAKGLIEGFKQIGKAVKGLFGGGGKGMKIDVDPKSLATGMKKIGRTLSGEASKLFAVMDLGDGGKAGDQAKNLAAGIEDGMKRAGNWLKELWDKIVAGLKAAWQWIKDTLIQPIIDSFIQAWRVIMVLAKEVWEGLKAVWMFVYNSLIKPALDVLKATWQVIYDSILKPFLDVLKTTWDAVIGVLKAAWDGMMGVLKASWEAVTGVFVAAWDGIVSIFTAVWDSIKVIWDTMMDLFSGKISLMDALKKIWGAMFDVAHKAWDALVGVWQKMFDGVKKIFDKVIDAFKGVWDSFKEGASKIGESIWDAIKKGFKGIGDFFSDVGPVIWESVKKAFSGIGEFFKGIFDKLNPMNLFKKIFDVDMGGTGTVENTLGIDIPFVSFAQGGMVPGMASVAGDSLMNDRILAMLSPGEAIVPRSVMQDPMMSQLVRSIIDGNLKIPQFGFGEILSDAGGKIAGAAKDAGITGKGSVLSGIGDVLGKLDPREMWKLIEDKVMGMIMKMFEANKFHSGGLVGSYAFGGEVPAMLQAGEFVMNRGAVSRLGTSALAAANSGGGGSSGDTNIEMKIDIKTTQPIDEAFFRNTLIPRIKAELKRAGLDGQRVIPGSGVY